MVVGHNCRNLPAGSKGCLRVGYPQYERNGIPRPLVYRLSDRASPGSHAVTDKG